MKIENRKFTTGFILALCLVFSIAAVTIRNVVINQAGDCNQFIQFLQQVRCAYSADTALLVNAIGEYSAETGVTIDGCLIKDGNVDGKDVSTLGTGDVSKVATPVDNQVGVWTGDGTIEGTTGLTYNGSNFLLTGDIGATGTRITKGWFADLTVTNAISGSVTGNAGTVTTITGLAPDTATTQATQPNITSAANLATVGTITSGTLSTGAVLKDVTMTLGSDVDLDVYYRSSNKLTRLAKGTANQALSMNADASAIAWATVLSNPMTTALDIIVGAADGVPERLAKGANGTYLRVSADGSALEYGTPAGAGDTVAPATHAASYFPKWNTTPDSKTLVEGVAGGNASGNVVLRVDTNDIAADAISEITGAAGVAIDGLTLKDAGFALGSDADGDIYYRASGALARLAKGTAGQVVRMNTGATAPEWADQIKTIYIDAGAMVPCTTNGAATGTKEYATDKPEMDYFAFDGGATEERVQFKTVMPSNWNAGTITVIFHWSSATGSTAGDTVEFACKAVCLRNDDAIAAAFGTAQVITDTLLADSGADMQVSAATPAITIGGTPTAGSMVCFEVYRNTDGTDDMAEDAWLFGVEITYGAL